MCVALGPGELSQLGSLVSKLWRVSKIVKVTAKLFDGRDIHYFDDAHSTRQDSRKPDLREPAERPQLAELRHDPLTGEWVAVAAHRHTRAFLPPTSQCPLCPATPENLSEVPDNFDVAVFENKNPSFGALPEGSVIDDLTAENSYGLGETRPAVGKCEVVVFSPEHDGSLGQMPVERVHTVLEALADRTEELQRLPGVKQVFPFENRGQEIGVTLHHPHGQIYSYPYVTPKTQKLMTAVSQNPSLFDDILKFEVASSRLLLESESFVSYVPFAARWPIEAHLLPKRQVRNHAELSADERLELASMYSALLRAFEGVYETPSPYIAAWHQAPITDGGKNLRLQLQITSPRRAADKLKYLAGSESAMGAFIADIPSETIADQLRQVLS
jgi:UDPglucose--hexose-1-phosphate uridylyltransferase